MRLTSECRQHYNQHEMRTHGRKNGFVTKGQEAKLTQWLPKIGMTNETTLAQTGLDLTQPIVLEVGFGNGDFLAHLAQTHLDWQMIGIEIYLPGVAKAVSKIDEVGVIERCRISQLPAQFVLNHLIPDQSLDGIFINHPDPWPKKKHFKRRIIQKDFAQLLTSRLKMGGFIKLASDIEELAIWMRDILDQTAGLQNLGTENGFIPRDEDRPHTKFETRGLNAGRRSYFLHYQKIANTPNSELLSTEAQ
ncbi:MAG: tRNA (guanosine(46)-N7)-methyltransferase TrmB [Zetaproteobacteria bacterium]|nr:tRNA (guanosine(46)-N7)-methyltransferase TrmB [Zetaproteobacteria bacterium]